MTKKQVTKRQHHIPKMILKRFADNTDKVFMLDGKTGDILHLKLDSVAIRKHLYSVHLNDCKDDTLEQKFSLVESEAENILTHVLSNPDYNNPDDLKKLIEFVIILMIRTPRVVKIAETTGASDKMAKTLREKATEKGFSEEKTENYITFIQNNRGASFAETFLHSFKERFSQITENFDAYLCRAEKPRLTFVVSDTYAVLEAIGDINKNKFGTDWWKMAVQIYFPLSANHCIILTPKKDKSKIGKKVFEFGKISVNSRFIRRVNTLSFLQKENFLYGPCKKELERLGRLDPQ